MFEERSEESTVGHLVLLIYYVFITKCHNHHDVSHSMFSSKPVYSSLAAWSDDCIPYFHPSI